MEVKKCGFRIVYKKDIEDLNQTMAQSSNTNIIPYEGLDGKCTHGDYDGAGPSGEGSFNELPHSQRDERFTEFMAHGDSDCEEYLECSEEPGDWQESSESDLEGWWNLENWFKYFVSNWISWLLFMEFEKRVQKLWDSMYPN